MKTQAIRISAHGGPEVLQYVEVEVPDPGPDEVRVRHRAIGVNFIDIYYRTGLYASALPHGLGFEGAGVVEAVGSNVGFLKEGDRVAYPQGPLGAYAQVRTLPAATVVKLPRRVSDDDGGDRGTAEHRLQGAESGPRPVGRRRHGRRYRPSSGERLRPWRRAAGLLQPDGADTEKPTGRSTGSAGGRLSRAISGGDGAAGPCACTSRWGFRGGAGA